MKIQKFIIFVRKCLKINMLKIKYIFQLVQVNIEVQCTVYKIWFKIK